MKSALIKKVVLVASIGLFSQLALAQDNASAVRDIAGIVASMNHFASDADKAKLMAISEDSSLAQGVRDMAMAVAHIQHAAPAEDKATMNALASNEQVPEGARALAGIIANFNHMASADAKAQLAQMFPQ